MTPSAFIAIARRVLETGHDETGACTDFGDEGGRLEEACDLIEALQDRIMLLRAALKAVCAAECCGCSVHNNIAKTALEADERGDSDG